MSIFKKTTNVLTVLLEYIDLSLSSGNIKQAFGRALYYSMLLYSILSIAIVAYSLLICSYYISILPFIFVGKINVSITIAQPYNIASYGKLASVV